MDERDVYGCCRWKDGRRAITSRYNEQLTSVPKTTQEVIAEAGCGTTGHATSHLNRMYRNGCVARSGGRGTGEPTRYAAVPHPRQRTHW